MSRLSNDCEFRISPWHSRNESGPYTYYFLLQYAINHYNNNFRFFGTRLSFLWSSRKLSTTLHYHYLCWRKEIKLFALFSNCFQVSFIIIYFMISLKWFIIITIRVKSCHLVQVIMIMMFNFLLCAYSYIERQKKDADI